jgi:two-component system phosphate regulon sensor histidine kinase PhoR
MWSSRLFLKLFLTYAGLVLLSTGVCSAIIAGWQEEQLIEQVKRRLHDSATLLRESALGESALGEPAWLPSAKAPDRPAPNFWADNNAQLQAQVRALGQQTATRFTLIDAAGKVVADSQQPNLAAVAEMDNHLGRQEFVKAQHQGSGYSRRLSPTLQVSFLYFALPLEKEDQIVGYVRASQPLASILSEVANLRRLIGLAGLGVGLSGLVITFLLTRRIVQPIQELTEAAKEMAEGHMPRRVDIQTHDEVGALARAFEQMVSRLRKREKALRESADRQSTVLSGMNEGVLAVDANQRVLFANLAAGKLLGFSPEQTTDRTLLEVVRSHDLHLIVQHTLADEQLTHREIQWQGDSLRTLEVNAAPLPGEPCPGVVLVLHDVSELKRLEGLRQQFVANVSHELKTPLSSIKAYTETLLNGALEDQDNARRFLNRIEEQSERLHELILDMLSLARIESGHATIDRTAVALEAVASDCVAHWESRAQAAEVQLENQIASTDLKVLADEESLLQILNNLVDNAFKYTPAGGRITLACHAEGSDVTLEVTDTGIGIDASHHGRLFERFYRVDKARSRELGGTGLGLAIVKHLCQAMEGSVAIQSTPGAGSTFQVRLPRA